MQVIDNLNATQDPIDTTPHTTTIDVDENGAVADIESNVFTKTFNTRKEAMLVMDTLDELGFEQNYQFDAASKTMTLTGVEDKDLALLQRKVNIKSWSSKTIAVANAVTNFATDVADYALNGAVAPTIGAVSNAALTTGRVVGTATIKAGAMVLASTIRNGRAAATEIKHSREVKDAWSEVKGLGSDIANAIFGTDTEGASFDWVRAA